MVLPYGAEHPETEGMMEMIPVESSHSDAVGYRAEDKVLAVRFKGGSLSHDAGVEATVYAELMAAASVGSYLARVIKPAYTATRQPATQPPPEQQGLKDAR
jgi:hypothetical protein